MNKGLLERKYTDIIMVLKLIIVMILLF